MALVITELDTQTTQSSVTSLECAEIEPTGGALLVVVACALRTVAAPVITGCEDTFTGTGAWTERTDQINDAASVYNEVSIFTAQAGGTPGAGTITVSWTNASNRCGILVYEVTGHDTGSPVTQTKSENDNGSSPSLTLDSTPATDALVFGTISSFSDADGITQGTNFTELSDVETGGTPTVRYQAQYDIDNATTTVDWSSVNTSNNVIAAIEIAIASTGLTVVLDTA